MIPTENAPAAGTATPSVAPTLGNPPTLTPAPTNTLLAGAADQPYRTRSDLHRHGQAHLDALPRRQVFAPVCWRYRLRQLRPALPNRVRSQPGTSGTYLGMLQPGERMEIIGGPECANQAIWWQVRSLSSSLTGWTAEGDSKDYWLVPAP